MTEETSDVIKKPEKSSSSRLRDRTSKRDKVKPLNKVVIRRLPPSMTEETFLKQIEPLPDNENYYFVAADWSLGHDATARAYINFLNQDDIFLFKDRFDGYVFVDNKGAEYPAIVEFAPFQGMPRNKSRKKDPKANSIETDVHYISFLEELNREDSETTKPEFKLEYSYQIKDDKKITSTPLLQYLANKKQERRDERKRKLDDKRRQRDEERHRKKNQISKSMPLSIKEEEPKEDAGKDKLPEKRREREKTDDRKESRNRRRDQKRKEERERNLLLKSQENRPEIKRIERPENKEKDDDKEKKKETKKYSQSRREKQRSREESRRSESNCPDERDKESNISMVNFSNYPTTSSDHQSKSNDEISDSVKEFIKNVASCKEFVPRSRDIPTTSKNDPIASDNEFNMSEVRDKLEQMNVLERNKSIESNDSSTTESNRNRDLLNATEKGREDKNGRRIRNKDRPSLEIYQPRKMRLPSSSHKEDGSRSSSELKDYKSNPPSDCESVKKEKIGIRKKVSRYSERRSGRNRERSAAERDLESEKTDEVLKNDEIKDIVELKSDEVKVVSVDLKSAEERSEM